MKILKRIRDGIKNRNLSNYKVFLEIKECKVTVFVNGVSSVEEAINRAMEGSVDGAIFKGVEKRR